MKVFINNRNYLKWPRALAWGLQAHEVIFLDNASTYPPLLEWYEKQTRFEVIKLPNLGKTALWSSGIAAKLSEPFVLTDPDLDITNVPDDWPEQLLSGLVQYPHISKCGLSWDESKVPPENPAYTADGFDKTPNNTSFVWQPMPDGNVKFSNYPCDTSFAVYRNGAEFRIDGIRRVQPYTGMHLPWHIVLDYKDGDDGKIRIPVDEEIYYYFTHVENSSFTESRVRDMMRLYQQGKS